MGCVSSANRHVSDVSPKAGKDDASGKPSASEAAGSQPNDDDKIENASVQRRRLSVAPLLVGDVEGKRITPSVGKSRRMSFGFDPPQEHEDLARSAVETPSSISAQSWVALSKKGYVPYNRKKMNQDAYFVAESFIEGVSLYGVCDGHGEFGHHVSAFFRDNIVRCLSAEKDLKESPSDCIMRAVQRLCSDLSETQINVSFSGTTAVFAIRIGQTIIVGNVGDSRCIVLQRSGKELIPIPLSRDQKPDDPDEKKRILAAGGRVEPLPGPANEDMGPCRVWLAEIDVPGLAMSRSIGDEVSHTVGVSSDPEIRVYTISESDQFLVLASDGVWEFLTNQQVATLVATCADDMEAAAASVVQESTKRWQEVEEVIDDITFVILQLQPIAVV